MQSTLISDGNLSAKIDLNDPNGWAGLGQLAHRDFSTPWLLSPALTLEHYIGVPPTSDDYIEYEPCYSPKDLVNVDQRGCTLRYGAASCSQVTCEITYSLVTPDAVDVMVELVTSRDSWPLGSLALLFATITAAPSYSGVVLRGCDSSVTNAKSSWIHFNGHAAQPGRIIHPNGVANPELRRPDPPPPTYYYDDCSIRFDEPFFFGNIGDMFLGFFVPSEHRDRVRFVVNPHAPAFGGPAWDLVWVIPSPRVGASYKLPLRLVFRRFRSVEDVYEDYRSYDSR